MTDDADSSRRTTILLWAFLALGSVFRLLEYLDRRSLWYDEAMLSLNVASRSWAALLRPLDYEQAAPVPFLWAQKLLVTLGGVNEYSLRLLSLVGGLLLPVLVWKLARRLFGAWESALATALVAISPMLVRYSDEAKPYELDAVVAVVVALMAVRLVENPRPVRPWMVLGLGGALALTLSIPSAFVLAAVGVALMLAPSVRTARFGLARASMVGALWAAMFVLLDLVFYRHAAANHPYILKAWEFTFLRPGAPDIFGRVWFAVTGVMSGNLVGTLDVGRWGAVIMNGVNAQAIVATILSAVGLTRMARRQGVWLPVLLAGGIAAAAAASTVGKYPITVRLMLFAAPFVFVALAQGIFQVADWLPERRRTLAVVLLAASFVGPAAARGVLTSISPIRRQDAREVVAQWQRQRQARDTVYVYPHALFAWAFYSTDWTAPDAARLQWIARIGKAGAPGFPASPSRRGPVVDEGAELVYPHDGWSELIGVPTGRVESWGDVGGGAPNQGWAENEARRMQAEGGRVWVFFVPLGPGDREPNLGQLQAAIADRGGVMQSEFHRREADLYLYQFGPGR